jgi:hypothetical protein
LASRRSGKHDPQRENRSAALAFLLGRQEQHHWSVQFLNQGGLSRDLLRRRAPFLDAPDGEARSDQYVQRRAQGSPAGKIAALDHEPKG